MYNWGKLYYCLRCFNHRIAPAPIGRPDTVKNLFGILGGFLVLNNAQFAQSQT